MKSESDPQNAMGEGVESRANFEGNDTNLMIERVNDPVIRSQIVEMLYLNDQAEVERLRGLVFTPFSLPDMPDHKCFKDQHGMVYASDDPNYDPRNTDFEPRTREQISAYLEMMITEAATRTVIDFTENEPNRDCMPLNWKVPWTGQKPTTKQMSIIEAHENGHSIRQYQELDAYFSKGFDTSKVRYTDKDFELDVSTRTGYRALEELTRENMMEETMQYLFSAVEIAERMSQLKNYFGLNGPEAFTREHLRYAREHYVPDTGMDNRMGLLFQAITPETEDTFIGLINTSGI